LHHALFDGLGFGKAGFKGGDFSAHLGKDSGDRPNASEFELNIIASLAQEERRLISERTKAALAIRKEQGAVLGQVGRQVAATKAKEATEAAINRATQLKEEGTSLAKIADILNAEGFTTSRGSSWTKQALLARLKTA